VKKGRASHLKDGHRIVARTEEELSNFYRFAKPEERFKVEEASGSENALYEGVKAEFEKLFKFKFGNCHLEITAYGNFSTALREKVRESIVFNFIRRMKGSEHRSPDITGFADQKLSGEDFITVEFKNEPLELWDIYQAKMYAELFNAKYGFLVSTDPIPPELKRLHQVHFIMSRFIHGTHLCLVQFDTKTSQVIHETWFPEKPFDYDPRKFVAEYHPKPPTILELVKQLTGSDKLVT
jgi:hypothetical protein